MTDEHAWSVRLDEAKGGWIARCSCAWRGRRPTFYKARVGSLGEAARRGDVVDLGHACPKFLATVTLPPAVAAEAQRILDREARRLLAARLDADAIRATTGADNRCTDHSLDEVALPLVAEQFPIAGADRDSGRGGSE